MLFSRASACGLLFAAFTPLGCHPNVNPVPLGLGPLALAERTAQNEAAAARNSQQRERNAATLESDDFESEEEPDDFESEENVEGIESGEPAAGEPNEKRSVEDFAGLFSGDDVATFRFSGLPKQRQEDPKAKIRVELGSAPAIAFILINSDTGEDLCRLAGEIDTRPSRPRTTLSATLESDQPCFTEGDSPLSAIVTSGKAILRGETLTLKAKGDLESKQDDQVLTGRLRYSFTGTRD